MGMFNQTLFDEPTDESTDKPTDEPIDKPTDESTTDEPIDEQTKFVFGILNGRIWKSRLMSKMNFSSENSDELNKENNKIIECNDDDKKTYKYLDIHSNLYMNTVPTLFQKATTKIEKESTELTQLADDLIKWDIRIENGKINLAVSTVNKRNTEWHKN
ncbi:unnamed protein product [Rhizophagus irregularis]|nr:unnamed protein product [Rhizophagus irregularis]